MCVYVSVCVYGVGWGGGEVDIVSPLYVRPSRPFVPYVTLLVSVRYLLKGLVYWIEIFYTDI